MNVNNELFFPPELIVQLRDLRDGEWRKLVDKVSVLPDTHPDVLAFAYMIVQLSGCLSCGPGSFRHIKGCLSCSRQAVGSFKGSDGELVALWEQSLTEVTRYLGEAKGEIAA